jgi:3-phytase
MRIHLLPGALALLLAACATAAPSRPAIPAAGAPAGVAPATATVAEAFVSEPVAGEELDSLATWTAEDGRTLLVASAKSGHRLVLFDGDSGALAGTHGEKGHAPGQFLRPNGLAVFADLLFVVERDNRRVQVLSLPGLAPVGTFGGDELRSPYGIWLHETAPGELAAYVTDSFMDGERFDVVPPVAQLAERVRRYGLRVHADGTAVEARHLGAFGDTGAGALRMVESIGGDPVHDRLLVADEYRRDHSSLREYRLGGAYAGRSLPDGTFDGEAEGVVLWSCRNDGGYWIAVDQQAPLTRFHLFDRGDLSAAGSFSGTLTAQTDGIALHAASTPRFPAGALFAVHDDRAVVAFDLRDVVRALALDPDCLP